MINYSNLKMYSSLKNSRLKIAFLSLTILAALLAFWSFNSPIDHSLSKTAEAKLSPELYNSAFAPSGASGGEIIPASCSLGYPWDITDTEPNPCNPTMTIFSLGATPALTPSGNNYSVTIGGGGSVSFGYTSQYAGYCDVLTTMSEPGMGYDMYYVEGPNRNYNNLGPIANKNGWINYQIICRQNGDRGSVAFAEKSLRINVTEQPIVRLSFDRIPNPRIISFTGQDTSETTGELTWSVADATSCSATGASGWSGSVISPVGGTKTVSYPSLNYPQTYSYTLTCTDGVTSVLRSTTIDFAGNVPPGCFIAGTQVTMGDGTQKSIETVKAGEIIMTSAGPQRIERLWHIAYQGNLYAFNGSDNYFVTDSHPFMTTEGWKSFNPTKSKLENPEPSRA